ncbi:MAG: sigma-54-dependent Fis family transcriptional regulator [Deltaproteobacteria bacterium]|nr:sigma-54-dependent Fis family transcriptional regulator [Deltaproteobacteria bacterium]
MSVSVGSNVWLAGTSAPIREIERVIAHLANANVNMVIHGESGTGKRILAERIYREGPRASEPFISISLEKLGEAEIERVLFSEDGGALAPSAPRATIYLNAVDVLPLRLQAQMALALAQRDHDHDVRIIVGTSAPLEDLMRLGRFRRDLYFRLAVVRVALPPLRERREDIAVVADRVVEEWCGAAGAARPGLSRPAMAELMNYAWPGNSRELEQTLEAVLALSRGTEVTPERIRAVLGRRPRRYAAPDVFPLRQLERDYIAGVLSSCNWNQSLAARRLGIGRNTLMRKIKTFGLRAAGEAA